MGSVFTADLTDGLSSLIAKTWRNAVMIPKCDPISLLSQTDVPGRPRKCRRKLAHLRAHDENQRRWLLRRLTACGKKHTSH
jgi:hypothetical protein